jgi:hypothetical protein
MCSVLVTKQERYTISNKWAIECGEMQELEYV